MPDADLFIPKSRNNWTQIGDDVRRWRIGKHDDTTENYTIDFIDHLDGETISSLTSATGQGVSVSSSATATGRDGSSTTAVTLTGVTGTDGFVEVTIVTSGSQTLVFEFHFEGTPQGKPDSDYGNR